MKSRQWNNYIKLLKRGLWIFLLLITGLFLVKTFLFDIMSVRGISMVPTLYDGDKIIVTKIYQEIQKGDIVVFVPPKNDGVFKDGEDILVKRCFASPGDSLPYSKPHIIPAKGESVSITVSNISSYSSIISYETGSKPVVVDNKVWHNGALLEKYVFSNNWYFFIGDNYSCSYDSRKFGLVPENLIVGIVK